MQLYILILIPISSIKVSAFVLQQRPSCNPLPQLSYKETSNNDDAIPSFSIDEKNYDALHVEGVAPSNNALTYDSDVSLLLEEARMGFEKARMKAIEDDASKALDEADRLWKEAEEELLLAEMELMAIQGEEDMLLAEETKTMELANSDARLYEEPEQEQRQRNEKESEERRRAIQKRTFATNIEKMMTPANEETSKRSAYETEEIHQMNRVDARIERAKESAKSFLLKKHVDYEFKTKVRERARHERQRLEVPNDDDDAVRWRRLRELNDKFATRRRERELERRAAADEEARRERLAKDETLLRQWRNKTVVVETTVECDNIVTTATEIDEVADIIKQGYMICF